MNGIKSQVTKTSRGLAQHIAKTIAREPFEVLKKVPDQVLNERPREDIKNDQKPKEPENQKLDEAKEKEKSTRLAQAYEAELRDIKREKLFKDLQKKIAEGEDINLGDFAGLSWEQREVLEAQKVAIRERSQLEYGKVRTGVLESNAKPKRGLFSGIKTRVARMQRKSEIKTPPSG